MSSQMSQESRSKLDQHAPSSQGTDDEEVASPVEQTTTVRSSGMESESTAATTTALHDDTGSTASGSSSRRSAPPVGINASRVSEMVHSWVAAVRSEHALRTGLDMGPALSFLPEDNPLVADPVVRAAHLTALSIALDRDVHCSSTPSIPTIPRAEQASQLAGLLMQHEQRFAASGRISPEEQMEWDDVRRSLDKLLSALSRFGYTALASRVHRRRQRSRKGRAEPSSEATHGVESVGTRDRLLFSSTSDFALALGASTTETFRIDPGVHDVISVPQTVGSVLNGDAIDERAAAGSALHSAALKPLLLDPRGDSVSGAPPFVRHTQGLHNHDDDNVRASAFQTTRARPGAVSKTEGRIALLFVRRSLPFVLNFVSAVVERYPANVTAFYCLVPLLNDVALLLSRLNTCELGGSKAVPLPDDTSVGFGSNTVRCATMLAITLGNGLQKVLEEAERIIAKAAADYADNCASGGGEGAAGRASGPLLTVLCSVFQPLIAVASILPEVDPVANSLSFQLLSRSVELVAGGFRRQALGRFKALRQCETDLDLLLNFVTAHPWLGGALKGQLAGAATDIVKAALMVGSSDAARNGMVPPGVQ